MTLRFGGAVGGVSHLLGWRGFMNYNIGSADVFEQFNTTHKTGHTYMQTDIRNQNLKR